MFRDLKNEGFSHIAHGLRQGNTLALPKTPPFPQGDTLHCRKTPPFPGRGTLCITKNTPMCVMYATASRSMGLRAADAMTAEDRSESTTDACICLQGLCTLTKGMLARC